MKMKNQFYDLQPFNLIKPWKITDKEGHPVYFNFCSDIDTSCGEKDALIANPKTCKKFAGQHDQEKAWFLSKDKKKRNVLIVKFPPGDICGKGKNYQTTVELTCDPKVNAPKLLNDKSFDDKKM
jgi:hypothetical protein